MDTEVQRAKQKRKEFRKLTDKSFQLGDRFARGGAGLSVAKSPTQLQGPKLAAVYSRDARSWRQPQKSVPLRRSRSAETFGVRQGRPRASSGSEFATMPHAIKRSRTGQLTMAPDFRRHAPGDEQGYFNERSAKIARLRQHVSDVDNIIAQFGSFLAPVAGHDPVPEAAGRACGLRPLPRFCPKYGKMCSKDYLDSLVGLDDRQLDADVIVWDAISGHMIRHHAAVREKLRDVVVQPVSAEYLERNAVDMVKGQTTINLDLVSVPERAVVEAARKLSHGDRDKILNAHAVINEVKQEMKRKNAKHKVYDDFDDLIDFSDEYDAHASESTASPEELKKNGLHTLFQKDRVNEDLKKVEKALIPKKSVLPDLSPLVQETFHTSVATIGKLVDVNSFLHDVEFRVETDLSEHSREVNSETRMVDSAVSYLEYVISANAERRHKARNVRSDYVRRTHLELQDLLQQAGVDSAVYKQPSKAHIKRYTQAKLCQLSKLDPEVVGRVLQRTEEEEKALEEALEATNSGEQFENLASAPEDTPEKSQAKKERASHTAEEKVLIAHSRLLQSVREKEREAKRHIGRHEAAIRHRLDRLAAKDVTLMIQQWDDERQAQLSEVQSRIFKLKETLMSLKNQAFTLFNESREHLKRWEMMQAIMKMQDRAKSLKEVHELREMTADEICDEVEALREHVPSAIAVCTSLRLRPWQFNKRTVKLQEDPFDGLPPERCKDKISQTASAYLKVEKTLPADAMKSFLFEAAEVSENLAASLRSQGLGYAWKDRLRKIVSKAQKKKKKSMNSRTRLRIKMVTLATRVSSLSSKNSNPLSPSTANGPPHKMRLGRDEDWDKVWCSICDGIGPRSTQLVNLGANLLPGFDDLLDAIGLLETKRVDPLPRFYDGGSELKPQIDVLSVMLGQLKTYVDSAEPMPIDGPSKRYDCLVEQWQESMSLVTSYCQRRIYRIHAVMHSIKLLQAAVKTPWHLASINGEADDESADGTGSATTGMDEARAKTPEPELRAFGRGAVLKRLCWMMTWNFNEVASCVEAFRSAVNLHNQVKELNGIYKQAVLQGGIFQYRQEDYKFDQVQMAAFLNTIIGGALALTRLTSELLDLSWQWADASSSKGPSTTGGWSTAGDVPYRYTREAIAAAKLLTKKAASHPELFYVGLALHGRVSSQHFVELIGDHAKSAAKDLDAISQLHRPVLQGVRELDSQALPKMLQRCVPALDVLLAFWKQEGHLLTDVSSGHELFEWRAKLRQAIHGKRRAASISATPRKTNVKEMSADLMRVEQYCPKLPSAAQLEDWSAVLEDERNVIQQQLSKAELAALGFCLGGRAVAGLLEPWLVKECRPRFFAGPPLQWGFDESTNLELELRIATVNFSAAEATAEPEAHEQADDDEEEGIEEPARRDEDKALTDVEDEVERKIKSEDVQKGAEARESEQREAEIQELRRRKTQRRTNVISEETKQQLRESVLSDEDGRPEETLEQAGAKENPEPTDDGKNAAADGLLMVDLPDQSHMNDSQRVPLGQHVQDSRDQPRHEQPQSLQKEAITQQQEVSQETEVQLRSSESKLGPDDNLNSIARWEQQPMLMESAQAARQLAASKLDQFTKGSESTRELASRIGSLESDGANADEVAALRREYEAALESRAQIEKALIDVCQDALRLSEKALEVAEADSCFRPRTAELKYRPYTAELKQRVVAGTASVDDAKLMLSNLQQYVSVEQSNLNDIWPKAAFQDGSGLHTVSATLEPKSTIQSQSGSVVADAIHVDVLEASSKSNKGKLEDVEGQQLDSFNFKSEENRKRDSTGVAENIDLEEDAKSEANIMHKVDNAASSRILENQAIDQATSSFEEQATEQAASSQNFEKQAVDLAESSQAFEKQTVDQTASSRTFENPAAEQATASRSFENLAVDQGVSSQIFEKQAAEQAASSRAFDKHAVDQASSSRTFEKQATENMASSRTLEKQADIKAVVSKDMQFLEDSAVEQAMEAETLVEAACELSELVEMLSMETDEEQRADMQARLDAAREALVEDASELRDKRREMRRLHAEKVLAPVRSSLLKVAADVGVSSPESHAAHQIIQDAETSVVQRTFSAENNVGSSNGLDTRTQLELLSKELADASEKHSLENQHLQSLQDIESAQADLYDVTASMLEGEIRTAQTLMEHLSKCGEDAQENVQEMELDILELTEELEEIRLQRMVPNKTIQESRVKLVEQNMKHLEKIVKIEQMMADLHPDRLPDVQDMAVKVGENAAREARAHSKSLTEVTGAVVAAVESAGGSHSMALSVAKEELVKAATERGDSPSVVVKTVLDGMESVGASAVDLALLAGEVASATFVKKESPNFIKQESKSSVHDMATALKERVEPVMNVALRVGGEQHQIAQVMGYSAGQAVLEEGQSEAVAFATIAELSAELGASASDSAAVVGHIAAEASAKAGKSPVESMKLAAEVAAELGCSSSETTHMLASAAGSAALATGEGMIGAARVAAEVAQATEGSEKDVLRAVCSTMVEAVQMSEGRQDVLREAMSTGIEVAKELGASTLDAACAATQIATDSACSQGSSFPESWKLAAEVAEESGCSKEDVAHAVAGAAGALATSEGKTVIEVAKCAAQAVQAVGGSNSEALEATVQAVLADGTAGGSSSTDLGDIMRAGAELATSLGMQPREIAATASRIATSGMRPGGELRSAGSLDCIRLVDEIAKDAGCTESEVTKSVVGVAEGIAASSNQSMQEIASFAADVVQERGGSKGEAVGAACNVLLQAVANANHDISETARGEFEALLQSTQDAIAAATALVKLKNGSENDVAVVAGEIAAGASIALGEPLAKFVKLAAQMSMSAGVSKLDAMQSISYATGAVVAVSGSPLPEVARMAAETTQALNGSGAEAFKMACGAVVEVAEMASIAYEAAHDAADAIKWVAQLLETAQDDTHIAEPVGTDEGVKFVNGRYDFVEKAIWAAAKIAVSFGRSVSDAVSDARGTAQYVAPLEFVVHATEAERHANAMVAAAFAEKSAKPHPNHSGIYSVQLILSTMKLPIFGKSSKRARTSHFVATRSEKKKMSRLAFNPFKNLKAAGVSKEEAARERSTLSSMCGNIVEQIEAAKQQHFGNSAVLGEGDALALAKAQHKKITEEAQTMDNRLQSLVGNVTENLLETKMKIMEKRAAMPVKKGKRLFRSETLEEAQLRHDQELAKNTLQVPGQGAVRSSLAVTLDVKRWVENVKKKTRNKMTDEQKDKQQKRQMVLKQEAKRLQYLLEMSRLQNAKRNLANASRGKLTNQVDNEASNEFGRSESMSSDSIDVDIDAWKEVEDEELRARLELQETKVEEAKLQYELLAEEISTAAGTSDISESRRGSTESNMSRPSSGALVDALKVLNIDFNRHADDSDFFEDSDSVTTNMKPVPTSPVIRDGLARSYTRDLNETGHQPASLVSFAKRASAEQRLHALGKRQRNAEARLSAASSKKKKVKMKTLGALLKKIDKMEPSEDEPDGIDDAVSSDSSSDETEKEEADALAAFGNVDLRNKLNNFTAPTKHNRPRNSTERRTLHEKAQKRATQAIQAQEQSVAAEARRKLKDQVEKMKKQATKDDVWRAAIGLAHIKEEKVSEFMQGGHRHNHVEEAESESDTIIELARIIQNEGSKKRHTSMKKKDVRIMRKRLSMLAAKCDAINVENHRLGSISEIEELDRIKDMEQDGDKSPLDSNEELEDKEAGDAKTSVVEEQPGGKSRHLMPMAGEVNIDSKKAAGGQLFRGRASFSLPPPVSWSSHSFKGHIVFGEVAPRIQPHSHDDHFRRFLAHEEALRSAHELFHYFYLEGSNAEYVRLYSLLVKPLKQSMRDENVELVPATLEIHPTVSEPQTFDAHDGKQEWKPRDSSWINFRDRTIGSGRSSLSSEMMVASSHSEKFGSDDVPSALYGVQTPPCLTMLMQCGTSDPEDVALLDIASCEDDNIGAFTVRSETSAHVDQLPPPLPHVAAPLGKWTWTSTADVLAGERGMTRLLLAAETHLRRKGPAKPEPFLPRLKHGSNMPSPTATNNQTPRINSEAIPSLPALPEARTTGKLYNVPSPSFLLSTGFLTRKHPVPSELGRSMREAKETNKCEVPLLAKPCGTEKIDIPGSQKPTANLEVAVVWQQCVDELGTLSPRCPDSEKVFQHFYFDETTERPAFTPPDVKPPSKPRPPQPPSPQTQGHHRRRLVIDNRMGEAVAGAGAGELVPDSMPTSLRSTAARHKQPPILQRPKRFLVGESRTSGLLLS